MRIVHFSDIHISRPPRHPLAMLDKRVLGLCNYFFTRRHLMHPAFVQRGTAVIKALRPDLVVCTGDISNTGSPEELNAARELLKPIWNDGQCEFLYVPGNHDAYVPRRAFRQSLRDTFKVLHGNRHQLTDLPLELWRRNLHIYVINAARPTNIFSSAGHLGKETADQLRQWFEEPRQEDERRLLITHYALHNSHGNRLPVHRRLKEDNLICDALEKRQLDVLLCGHIHSPFKHVYSSSSVEICSGSLPIHGSINVLDYSPQSGAFAQFWESVGDSASETNRKEGGSCLQADPVH